MKTFYLAFFLIATNGLANNDQELEDRQKAATAIINDVGALERAEGYHQVALENYFYGNRGTKTLAEAWLKKSHSFIQSMNFASTVLDFKDEESLISALSTLEELFRDKAQTLGTLTVELEQIRRSQTRIETLQALSNEVARPVRDEFKSIDAESQKAGVRLLESSHSIVKSVADRLISLEELFKKGKSVILLKIRARVIKLGLQQLNTTLDRAEQTLTFTTDVLPIILTLEKKEARLTDFLTSLAFYHAEKAFNEIMQDCATFQSKLSNLSTSDSLKEQAVARKNVVCESSKSQWNAFKSLSDKPVDVVWEFSRVSEAKFLPLCEQKSPIINCEKLAVLRSIPKSKVKVMDAEHLRFYENSWFELTNL